MVSSGGCGGTGLTATVGALTISTGMDSTMAVGVAALSTFGGSGGGTYVATGGGFGASTTRAGAALSIGFTWIAGGAGTSLALGSRQLQLRAVRPQPALAVRFSARLRGLGGIYRGARSLDTFHNGYARLTGSGFLALGQQEQSAALATFFWHSRLSSLHTALRAIFTRIISARLLAWGHLPRRAPARHFSQWV